MRFYGILKAKKKLLWKTSALYTASTLMVTDDNTTFEQRAVTLRIVYNNQNKLPQINEELYYWIDWCTF